MYNIEKSYSIKRLIIIIIMMAIVVVGSTFAWFTYQSKRSALVLTIGDINDTQIILSPYQINEIMAPGTTYESGVYSEVEVTKGNNNSTSFALFYKINELDPALIDNGLSYTVTNTQTGDVVKTGKFSDLIDTSKQLPDEVIILDANTGSSLSQNTSVNYKVYLWLDSSVGSQNNLTNSKLDVELNGSIGSVVITGNSVYGQLLSTTINEAVVDSNTTYTYQWYYNSSNSTKGGTAITDATDSTYKVDSGLVGKYIYVVVTSSNGKTLSDITDNTNNYQVNNECDNYNDGRVEKETPLITLSSMSGTVEAGPVGGSEDDYPNAYNSFTTTINKSEHYELDSDYTGTLTAVSANTSNVTIISGASTSLTNLGGGNVIKYHGEPSIATQSNITVTFTPSDTVNICSVSENYSVNKKDTTTPLLPTDALTTTSILKSNTQTVTLKCTDTVGITGYYFGTTKPTATSTFKAVTSTNSLNVTETVDSAGTYYFACKDSAGNTTVDNEIKQVYYTYNVDNLLETLNGTAGTYTSDNYVRSSYVSYIIPSGTTLVLNDIYTLPAESSSSLFKGYSTGYSTSVVTPSTTNPVVSANNMRYYLWFDRVKYNVTVSKPTNGTIKAETVTQKSNSVTASTAAATLTVKYGDTVKATATPATGYGFTGWSGGYLSGTTNPSTGAVITAAQTITASFGDSLEPVVEIGGGTTLKSTSQSLTLKCSDNVNVTAYYWGTTKPTAASSITTTTSISSVRGSGLAKSVTAANTYYLGCKDAAGNFAVESIIIRKYVVNNLLEKIAGTTGTYTSDNYTSASTGTYYIKDGTTLTLSDIYTVPTGASADTFKGYSTGYTTSAATVSTTNPKVADNNTTTYYMWFNRTKYNVTVTKPDNGTVKAETVTQTGNSVTASSSDTVLKVKYGDKVKATATASTGYTFNGWSGGYLSGTTNPSTGATVSADKTVTGAFADKTKPTASVTTTSTLKSASQTVTLACSDGGSGISSYYFGTSSSPSSDSYEAVTSTKNFSKEKTVSAAGTYYLFCKDGAGNVNAAGTALASGKVIYYSYTVNNLLEKIAGTTGTYRSTNYESVSSVAYIAPSGTTLTLASIYTIPTGASVDTFKGYSTGYSSSSSASPSKTAPTIASGKTYYMWFNRLTYTVTVSKPTNGTVKAETEKKTSNSVTASTAAATLTVKYGDTVKATATASTGYNFTGWSGGYLSGTTNPATGAVVTANKTITGTFAANELTFENQSISKTFSTSSQTASVTAASNGTGTYTYTEKSEKNSSGTSTSYISLSGSTITLAANTPADTYTYVITAKDSNSGATKDATYTLTVSQDKTATTGSCASLTYTGSAQTLASGGNYVTYKNNSGTNATSYTVTVETDGNHQFSDGTESKTLSCSIGQKSLTPSVTATNKTYDGGTSATCSVTLTGAVSSQNPTATATGAFADADVGTGKTVTCSSITLGSSWTTNYKLNATSKTTTANITAKEITVAWGSTTIWTYDGSSHTPTVTTPATGVGSEKINLTVSGAQTNVGSYTATASCSSVTNGRAKCSNYSLKSNTKSFTITKVNSVCPTVTAYSGTYDGSAHSVTVSGGSGGTIQYRTSTTGSWTTTKPTRTNAGTTTTYVQIAGDGNHNTVDCGNKTITISKATPTLTLSATSGSVNYGSTATFKVTTKSTPNAAGTLTATSGSTSYVTITGGASTSITATNSGVDTTITYKGVGATTTASTVTVTFTPTDTTNFNTASKTFSVSAVNKINATCPTVTAYSGTYDGSAHSVSVSGGSGGTIQYRTSTTGSWTTTKPTRTNAGTTTTYVQIAGDSNHNTVDCGNKTITISKATPTLTLSATSGTVEAGSTATFKATTKATPNAAGTLTASSGTTSRVTITGGASASVTATSSGVDTTITYKGGTTEGASTITVTFTPTDTTNVNTVSKTFTATNDDTTAPTVPTYTAAYADGGASYTSGTWTNKQVNTTISTTESGVGGVYIQYQEKGTSTWNTFSFSGSGGIKQSGNTWSGTEPWGLRDRNQYYYFRACDAANNCSAKTTDPNWNIRYDETAPVLLEVGGTISSTSNASPGYYAYYASDNSSYTSGSGATSTVYTRIKAYDSYVGTISKIQYTANANATTEGSDHTTQWKTLSLGISSGIKKNDDGSYYGIESWSYYVGRNDTFYFRACDSLGNCSAKSSAYNIKYVKATNPIAVTTPQSWSATFSTSSQTKAITAATGAQGSVTYEIQSQESGSTTVSYFSISSTTVTMAANVPAGSYKVVIRATAAGNDNYNSGYKDITLNVTVAQAKTATTGSCASLTYNGSAQTLASGGSYVTYSNNSGTNATSYTVTVTTDGNHQFSDGAESKTLTCSIGQKSLTPSVTATNKTYDGGTSATCSVTLTGAVSSQNPTATATGAFADADVGTGKTVTCSSITLGSSWTTNYKLSTTSKTTTANITAKEITVAWGSTTSWTYDGSSHAPTVTTPATGVGSEMINLTVSGTQTNVGSYTATASCSSVTNGRAKCSNYSLKSNTKTFTITKVNAVCPTVTAYSGIYDGSAHSVSVSGGSGGTIQYRTSTTGSWTTTKPTRTNAGTTTVYVQVAGDSNHNTVDCGNKTITISQKTPNLTDVPTSLAITVPSNNPKTFTYKYDGDGTVSCSSSNTSIATCSVNTSTKVVTVTGVAAGSATVTTSASAGTNYSASSKTTSATVTMTTYAVKYNILYGLTNVSTTTSENMTYSVSNGVVTVKANAADGYGFTNGRVYLEAGVQYTFSATTSGAWVNSGPCEAYLVLNGVYSTYYHMASNNNYTFTPTVSGEYWLRLDVNQNGLTHTFSNITIYPSTLSPQTKTYGSTLTLRSATPSRSGYTFQGWSTSMNATSATYAAGGGYTSNAAATLHAVWRVSNVTITFDANGGFLEENIINTVGETEFNVPSDGKYKLEVWGAQGGNYNETYYGGYGAYSSGNVNLEAGGTLYVNVGGKGTDGCNYRYCVGGYNGGGRGAGDSNLPVYSTGGGGATHIATTSGELKNLSSNINSILIVAGGGGGTSYQSGPYAGVGGSGGGYIGSNGTNTQSSWLYGSGGTQSSGGASGGGNLVNSTVRGVAGTFGQGGDGNYYSGGGGGGYYGGGASNQAGAGGGSGYIGNSLLTNKVMYCYNCTTNNNTNTKTNATTNISEIPTTNYAKKGDGAAKIIKLVSTEAVANGSKYEELTMPTRKGYVFAGWNTKADGSGITYKKDSVVNLNADTTLYAVWESNYVAITFDINGGNTIETEIFTPLGETIEFNDVGETEYVVPTTGDYKLEVWGAQGAVNNNSNTQYGGYGGYSKGIVNLKAGTKLYLNVGGQGTFNPNSNTCEGGYNGGSGSGSLGGCGGGGGASHIATVSGQLSTLESYKGSLYSDGSTYNSEKILIVAGGGGGWAYYSCPTSIGGSGGGYTSEPSVYAATQTSGGPSSGQTSGSFGKAGYQSNTAHSAAGAGGGWYGGGIGSNVCYGGGGSGYIGSSLLTNKVMYCYNCKTSTGIHTKTYSTENASQEAVENYAKLGSGAIKITLGQQTKNAIKGQTYGTLPVPTRAGYVFKEWNTKADGTGETITSDTIVNLTGEQTLYAIWDDSIVYIYNNGTLNTDLASNISFNGSADCYLSNGTSSFSAVASNGGWGTEARSAVAYFNTPIDLTNYKTLVFEGSFSRGSGHSWNGIGIWSSTTYPDWTNQTRSSTTLTNGVSTIDVSDLSGTYYIGIWGYYNGTSVTCNSMRLEK